LPGIDSNGITIEMGSLYSPTGDNSPNAPKTGIRKLLKFKVCHVFAGCKVKIRENTARGGIVLTNAGSPSVVNSPGYTFPPQLECLIGGNADGTVPGSEYAAWAAWGKPSCWCYARQCRGDIDGKKTGVKWVAIPDLTILYAAYNKTDAQLAGITNGICADLDHKKTGVKRVAIPDLTIAYQYYNKAEGLIPLCNQAPIITGPYNFWTTP